MLNFYIKPKSLFIKIIVLFFSIMIPLYIVGFILYTIQINTIRNQISQNMSQQASYYLSSLETEVGKLKLMQVEFLNDEELNYLANAAQIMSDIDKTMSISRVQQRLVSYKYSSQLIDNVTVYIPDINRTMSSKYGTNQITSDYDKVLEDIGGGAGANIIRKDNNLYIYAAFPQKTSYEKSPVYVVETQISLRKLEDGLVGATPLFGGNFLYDNVNSEVLGASHEVLSKAILNSLNGNNTDLIKSVKVNNAQRYLVCRKYSPYLNMTFYAYADEASAYASVTTSIFIFILFTIVTFIAVIIFAIQSKKLIHAPISRLVHAFRALESGDLKVNIQDHASDEFEYLYSAFNKMTESLHDMFEKVYRYEVLTKQAQLKQLQSQINPHFLYNSLYIIYRMAKTGDTENILNFANHLNMYYRYINRNAKDEVFLEQEIEHAKNYTSIQQTRFQDRIKINWEEVPDHFLKIIVPRLILQPLIENAFEHGLKDIDEGGVLNIRFEETDKNICIIVENNGVCPQIKDIALINEHINSDEYNGEITALINIHRRINLKFGQESGLSTGILNNGYFYVRLTISKTF